MGPVLIVSFGYGHGAPPQAEVTFDVRHHFRDPHVDPALRYLTGADSRVVRAVLGTPGAARLAQAIAATARAYRYGPTPAQLTVAVGCAGGRHRSAVLADEAARLLEADGVPVTVTHRDISRPVIERGA